MAQEKKSSCGGHGDALTAQLQDRAIHTVLGKIHHKLFVMSGKGGVGKSTVAANLAVTLAEKGKRVGLLDVDIHGPNIPRLLGLQGGLEAKNEKILRPKAYNNYLSVVSMDSLLQDTDQAILWRGPMKTSAIRQFISDVEWGELDFLVIDSPPGTGDEPMTVLKTVPDCQALVITTPHQVSLADVRKALNFLEHAKANVLGIVESMSGLICPHCQQEIFPFGKGKGADLAKKYDLPLLASIPLDPQAAEAADNGQPVVLQPGDSPAKKALVELAETIMQYCK